MTFVKTEGVAIMPPLNDLVLAILKPLEGEVSGLKVRTLIEPKFTSPYVLVRVTNGAWNSDSFGGADRRFLKRALVDVQVFTDGPDSDTSGDALSELCYQYLRAAVTNRFILSGVGSINFLRISSPPRKVADWQTATGVNQYANLPQGSTRYQATYGVIHRPDRQSPMTAADLVALASL